MTRTKVKCSSCSHPYVTTKDPSKARCRCGSYGAVPIDKEEFKELQDIEKEIDGDEGLVDIATPTGELQWDTDPDPLPPETAPPPTLPPEPVLLSEDPATKEMLAMLGSVSKSMALFDRRMTFLEKQLGNNGDGKSPAAQSQNPTEALMAKMADGDNLDMNGMVNKMLAMSMVQSLTRSMNPPAPVAPGEGVAVNALRQEIRDLASKMDQGKSIEPQLINSLQTQVESMRQETARREDNKILQAIMATRQHGPSELETFMAGMNMGAQNQRQAVTAGQDAFAQSQAAFSNAAADLLRGDGSAPLRSTAKDFMGAAVENMKNQQFVDAQRAAGGAPPGGQGQVQEVPLDQVAQEMDAAGMMEDPMLTPRMDTDTPGDPLRDPQVL